MGHGHYSSSLRLTRATNEGYYSRSRQEVFSERNINSEMNPFNIELRESRDSNDHPQSLAIILALDVTGSMGTVPHHLVKNGLPNIVDGLINVGIQDPQILFMGIGDHECDNAPLQVGQFESSDELLDHWLTKVYLEGGGGGNDGESYFLAWYFAAFRTACDCLERRNQKGFLFTIGDEHCLPDIKASAMKDIMGNGQFQTYHVSDLLAAAREKYSVHHINIGETPSGRRYIVAERWRELIGEDFFHQAIRKDEVPSIITSVVNVSVPSDGRVLLI